MKRISDILYEKSKIKRNTRLIYIGICLYFTLLAMLLAIGSNAMAEDRQTIERIAIEESAKYGIDHKLVLGIIQVESGFNPNAIGTSHGEIGLMQLHPRYFPKATFDIRQNISQGVQYLAFVKKQKLAEGCSWFVYYNVGVNRKLNYPTKHSYYKKVIQTYPQYCEQLQIAGN